MTVRHVPLFPLSTVLFPNMVLSLHVFEPRYREMVSRCVDQDMPFGVLLIKSGPGPGGVAEPYEIGTMARITEVERLEDGRLNVVTVGVNRFRLHGISSGEAYLTGDIEFLEEAESDPAQVASLARRVHGLFQRYVQLYLQLVQDAAGEAEADEEEGGGEDVEALETVEVEAEADSEADDALEAALRAELQADSHDGPDLSVYTDRPELPRHPGALSYAVAAMANWTGQEKQELLELSAAEQRLAGEVRLLRRDIASMLALQHLRELGGRPPFIGPCSAN